MGKRKIKRIKRTIRVSCDGLEYEDEDGEIFYPRVGQWVEIRKKTSGRDYATMLHLAELAGDDDDIDESQLDEAARAALSDRNMESMTLMVASLPDLYTLLAHKIVAWNLTNLWSDEGELLPPPTVETMETLDFETDLLHLIGLIMETEETPKN